MIFMNNKDIINFKNQINNFSIDELNDERVKLQEQMSKMILENDLLIKISIVETALQEKLEKETKNG